MSENKDNYEQNSETLSTKNATIRELENKVASLNRENLELIKTVHKLEEEQFIIMKNYSNNYSKQPIKIMDQDGQESSDGISSNNVYQNKSDNKTNNNSSKHIYTPL
jgi:hypothetical protein